MFNNRELALLIWLGGGLLLVAGVPKLRRAVAPVVKAGLVRKLVALFAAVVIWTSASTWILSRLSVWTTAQFSELFFWFFGPALVLLFRMDEPIKKPHYVRRTLWRLLEWSTVIAFLGNLFTFGIVIELLLVPLFVFLGFLQAAASQKPETKPVATFVRGIFAIVGIVFLSNVVWQAVSQPELLFAVDNVRKFATPVGLTILYLPFVFGFSVLARYETCFIRVDIFVKDRALARYAKWRIVRLGGLTPRRIGAVTAWVPRHLYKFESKAMVDHTLGQWPADRDEQVPGPHVSV